MAKQVLKDGSGRKIGEIRDLGTAKLAVYNVAGIKKGEYRKSVDLTYDIKGKKVGTGNLLATLL